MCNILLHPTATFNVDNLGLAKDPTPNILSLKLSTNPKNYILLPLPHQPPYNSTLSPILHHNPPTLYSPSTPNLQTPPPSPAAPPQTSCVPAPDHTPSHTQFPNPPLCNNIETSSFATSRPEYVGADRDDSHLHKVIICKTGEFAD